MFFKKGQFSSEFIFLIFFISFVCSQHEYGRQKSVRQTLALQRRSVNLIPPSTCNEHGSNENACRKEGCEFDLVNRQCVIEMQDCGEELFEEYPHCRRHPAFYASGGVICKNTVQSEETCGPELITALNLNGEDFFLPQRQIQFRKETDQDYEDPNNIRSESESNFVECRSKAMKGQEDFKILFSTSVAGEVGFKGCVNYPVKVTKDGQYELALWIIDTTTHKGKKCWDVKLNSVMIIFGLDPARLNNGTTCAKNELIILFRVQNSGSQILPQGFNEAIAIDSNTVKVQICMGTCTFTSNKIFQVSALSVVKYNVQAVYHFA